MRIVVVNKYAYVTGGADEHALGLTKILRAHGHDVALLSTQSERNVEHEGEFVALGVTHFNRDDLPLAARGAVAARAFWNREAAAAATRLIDRFRPDVFHAHELYPQLSPAPLRVARRRGVGVVQTLHDYELMSASSLDDTGGWIDRDEQRALYRVLRSALHPWRRRVHVPAVDEWVAVAGYVADRYAEHGVGAHVLPNFIERPPAEPLPFEQRRGVLFFGRLTEPKGTRDVVELARSAPGVEVTVAGSGPLEDEVARAAGELPNLDYAGWLDREAMAARLASARVVVVPSRWAEPGALAVLEAMAVGTPIVIYPSGGAAGYVRDARAGRVVAFGAEHLAAAAAELQGDRATWEAASAAGLEAIRTTHSPERYVERLLDVYRAAARGPRSGPARGG